MLLEQIEQSVQDSLAQVLASNQWRRYEGDYSFSLTTHLQLLLGCTNVHLASSGTAALEMILRGAGIGRGDEVLLSAYDYPGNFWAIERCGARPVLVDVASGSWAIDHDALNVACRNECKAVLASHLHGELQPTQALRSWCDERRLLLVEDACQSLGANCLQTNPQSSEINRGHATIISFGGGKVISCGRGGAWGTSDDALAQRAKIAAGAGSGPYMMSELQAAVVLAQLPWLEEINACSRNFFKVLHQELLQVGCNWKFVPETSLPAAAFYQAGWQIPGGELEAASGKTLRDYFVGELQRTSHFENSPYDGASSKENVRDLGSARFGAGFPGFHRRSQRRCRIPSVPINAALAAANTIVLSHQAALLAQPDFQSTAERIASRIQAIAATIQ